MEYHPIANMFPLMQGKEFDELCEDIKKNGLQEPIWIYEGKILDGRNRERACERVSVTPEFRQYEGNDPLGFVASQNLYRRHLTRIEKARIASNMANRGSGGKTRPGDVTGRQAAKALGVTRSEITAVRALDRDGAADLISAVEKGKINLINARRISTLAPEQQERIASMIQDEDNRGLRSALREVAPDKVTFTPTSFARDLDQMAVRMIEFFTAPQIALLWDIIQKKQVELAEKGRASR